MGYLKPFMINQTDIQFILDQLNFVPLFDAQQHVIVAWDGTGKVYDFNGNLLVDGGNDPTAQQSINAVAQVGTSYQNYTDLAGTRDVSGFWNNLTFALRHYGDTGYAFPRMAAANYSNYLQQTTAMSPAARPVAGDLAALAGTIATMSALVDGQHTVNQASIGYPGGSYSFTYDTWTRLTTTEQQTTKYIDGGHIFASLTQIDTVTTTQSDFMVGDSSGEHVATAGTPSAPVSSTGDVIMSGGELDGMYHHFSNSVASDAQVQTAYALDHQSYAITKAVVGSAEGNTFATDGTAINVKNVVDYTPRMISRTTTTAGVTYDTWANHAAENTLGANGMPMHTANEIYYNPSTGEAHVLDWGLLETVANGGEGQVDTQARLAASAGQGDHFIGSLNPGVSPSNGFFVLFGQFFDHGLDFVDKGQTDASGRGVTIKIALALDDPLYGMTGNDGQPVTSITITRATVETVTTSLDANGNPVVSSQYVNHVSPFIDQSQTYGSDTQRTLLLREWVSDTSTAATDDFHAGMKLLDGTTLATSWTKPDGTQSDDTLPTLNELRTHIAETGRSDITWEDIGNLRERDAHGVVVDTNGAGTAGGYISTGEALLLDLNPRFDTTHLFSGNADQDQQVTDAINYLNSYGIRPGDSFAMVNDVLTLKLGTDMNMGPGQPPLPANTVLTGASALAGWVDFSTFGIMQSPPGIPAQFVDGVRDAVSHILVASVGDHYIAGDGRVNENFGLTSIHHIFHEEHNFQVDNLIDALHRQDVATNDTTHEKLHEFQIATGTMNAAGDYTYSDGTIAWDVEKVFQGAKLIVEMEYQHAAVDQYARNVSPNIQEFVGYSPDKNPDVSLEYSQVAFRFGHSTLRETIDTIDPTHGITGKIMGYALHDAFLAPEMYSAVGPAAILLGMTHQQQSEIDEFVTPALNQGLLGQPLDLAAINIARGRDVGMPTLNDFREAVGLARYTSWNDFGQNMQHPSSLVNFMAAYSFDGDVAKAQAVIDLASSNFIDPAAGTALGSLLGWVSGGVSGLVSRAIAFLSGDDSMGGLGTLGFNQIDTWLGGLAEIHQPGGLLGETFDLVFVTQIEALMDGDRFYYLYRLAGQQFGEEVANAQLKDIVERNSGLTHLNGNIFGYADQYVDLGAQKENAALGTEALTTGDEHKYGDIGGIAAGTIGIYSNGGLGNGNDGQTITIGGKTYIQDTRLSADNPMSELYDATGTSAYAQNGFVNLDGTPNSGAESNEVIVGTKGDDLIYAQGGDDTVYGEDGDDIIYGGYGIDRLYGGAGSDHIYGGDNPDLIDGGSGDDWLYGESSGTDINGSDQIIGGSGNDHIYGGIGIDKLSAGSGDDWVYGGQDTDPFTHGGDGNDYVDGGSGGDILYGDNGDDVVVGGADQDQLFGNDGDDILRPGDPTGALTIGGDEALGGDGTDVNDKGFDLIDFSDNTDRPKGVSFDLSNQQNPATTPNGSSVQLQSYQIDGVIGSKSDDTLIGDDANAAGAGSDASIAGNNWLIGGSGDDSMTGGGGNDIIVGGSIRLDALIGKYNTSYDHNNNNAGVSAADQLQDARYQGASHRVTYDDVIDNSGLLGHSETAMFDKHFTEMLRTEMFQDMMLGDGGLDGTADSAIYTGNLSDYHLTALDAQGNVVVNPHLNWNTVFAVKIEDTRTDADFVDANGNPLTDANGNLLINEGTDLVIGVEQFVFADQTINPQAYFDIAPTLDLNYVAATASANAVDTFSGAGGAYSHGSGWNSGWVESSDNYQNGNGRTADNTGQIHYSSGGGDGTGGSLQINGGVNSNGASSNGASIYRGVDLNHITSAHVSFWVNESNLGTGEAVLVYLTANGSVGNNATPIYTINGGTNTAGQVDLDVTGNFSSNSRLYFVASSMISSSDVVVLDKVSVTGSASYDAAPGINYSANYTEQLTPAKIAGAPLITDPDDSTVASATITLRNPVAGDRLNVGTLPPAAAGIAATGNGTTTITLTGVVTAAAYQAALAAITFSNPTNDNPTNADRYIDVTASDGLKESAVATTTVHVTPVDDPATTLASDAIVTNIGFAGGNASNQTPTITVADWMLTANDTDVDGVVMNNAITNVSGLSNLNHSGGNVSFRDGNGAGGSFTYSSGALSAQVSVTQQASGTLNATSGNGQILLDNSSSHTINGGAGNDIIVGGGGNDTVNAGEGDDTIVWNANSANGNSNNGTDGRDIVDGGSNGTAGDTFIINGSNSSEAFTIFTKADWIALGGGNGSTGHSLQNNASEIIITRGTNPNNGNVIAELRNVEELVINTANGNDTVTIVGNFDPTQLAYNTIHINDADGGDLVDISGLTSEHRIVFSTDTNGHVTGDLRPQDLVNTDGPSAASGPVDTTPPPVTDPTHPVGSDEPGAYDGSDDGAGQGAQPPADDGDMTPPVVGNHEHDGDDDHDGEHEHESEGGNHHHHHHAQAGQPTTPTGNLDPVVPATAGDGMPIIGTANGELLLGTVNAETLMGLGGDDQIFGFGGDDVIDGGAGNDHLDGGAGNDVIFGGANDDTIFGGDDNDLIGGDDGNDWIFGGAGNDLLTGGAGNDTIVGGAGDDLFVAGVNDGDDTYFGDEFTGGSGNDTLDMSAISANITADLGTGVGGYGSVMSSMTGNDALFSIENIITGSGDDVIRASNAINVMDGGAGNDTFRFGSAAAADGDTIVGFEPGDKIDLSEIDANAGTAGDQSFTLVAGSGAAHLLIEHETRSDGEYTVVSGFTADGAAAAFHLNIAGNHNLTETDFNL